MERAYRAGLDGRTKLRSPIVAPRNGVFFGEGQPPHQAGIPMIARCPSPDHLCAAPADGGLDKLDAAASANPTPMPPPSAASS